MHGSRFGDGRDYDDAAPGVSRGRRLPPGRQGPILVAFPTSFHSTRGG
jgi:hypothetical protein